MAHELAESSRTAGRRAGPSGQRATRRALRFILIPVVLMAVLAIVSFDGDWTLTALTESMALVVMGMMYLERRRTEQFLPEDYRRLVAEVVARSESGMPASEAGRAALERLVRMQDELDVLEGRGEGTIQGVNPTLGIWAGALGSLLWLLAAVVAFRVHEVRGGMIALVMSSFFGGLAWFTRGERRRREEAVSILEEEVSRARREAR
jgi:uncharacterized membrane protein YedE/YeeE